MRAPGEQDREAGGTPARPSRRGPRADRTYVPPPADARQQSIPARLATGQRLIVSEVLALLLGMGLMVFVEGVSGDDESGGRIDLMALRRNLRIAGLGDAVLAVPLHDGDELAALHSIYREERAPSTLPLFDDGPSTPADGAKLRAIVGSIEGQARVESATDGVTSWAVSQRDAEAACQLLAYEVEIVASVAGAAGLAGLLRYVREDRRRPIRTRRLPPAPAVVVLVRAG